MDPGDIPKIAFFGAIWKKHCGKHYPGMAMFQVVSLFDPDALIEVQGIAAR